MPLFVRFCERVVRRLSPHCSTWCTLNEPVGCAINGWLVGIHPPGGQGQLRTTIRVIFHMLLGHREVSRAIREAAAPAISPAARADVVPCIMIANNIVWFEAKWR